MRTLPMRYTRGGGAFCYNEQHPSLEWFQVDPYGKSRFLGPPWMAVREAGLVGVQMMTGASHCLFFGPRREKEGARK